MATMKPDPNEMINPRRRLARQAQEAGLDDDPAPTPVDNSTKATTMGQADFSGYRGARQARPSEAELERKIASRKSK